MSEYICHKNASSSCALETMNTLNYSQYFMFIWLNKKIVQVHFKQKKTFAELQF